MTDAIGAELANWQSIVERLIDLDLVTSPGGQSASGFEVHPLVRSYFRQRLKHLPVWREANRRLLEYFSQTAKEFPVNLEEMEPLFSAIYHGCQAGLQQQVFDGLYYERVPREEKSFLNDALGGNEEDVATLANFFDLPWSVPSANFNDEGKAEVLNFAGYGLRAIGRFSEAEQAMRAVIPIRESIEDFKEASNDNRNLSELLVFQGRMIDSIPFAKKAVEFAEKADRESSQTSAFRLGTLGNSLFLAGRIGEAETIFALAEERTKISRPRAPFLGGIAGFCRLRMHVHLGRFDAANTVLENIPKGDWKPAEFSELTKGLEILGWGILETFRTDTSPKKFTNIIKVFARAISQLRKASIDYYICLALCYQCFFLKCIRSNDDYKRAHKEAASLAARLGANAISLDLRGIEVADRLAESDTDELFEECRALGYHAFETVILPSFASRLRHS